MAQHVPRCATRNWLEFNDKLYTVAHVPNQVAQLAQLWYTGRVTRKDPKRLVLQALAEQKSASEAARMSGVSRRTVYRIKAEAEAYGSLDDDSSERVAQAAKVLGLDREIPARLNLPESDWVGRLDGILSKGCAFAEKAFDSLDPGDAKDVRSAAEMLRAIGTIGINWKLALVKVAEFTRAKKEAENKELEDVSSMSDEELLELAREALTPVATESLQ